MIEYSEKKTMIVVGLSFLCDACATGNWDEASCGLVLSDLSRTRELRLLRFFAQTYFQSGSTY
jgi:hypothetical protein